MPLTDDTVMDIWDRIRTNDETYAIETYDSTADRRTTAETDAVPNYVIAKEFGIDEEEAAMAANRLFAEGKVRTALHTLPESAYNGRGGSLERFYRPERAVR